MMNEKKKVVYIKRDLTGLTVPCCPSCNKSINVHVDIYCGFEEKEYTVNFCPFCGQALDWDEIA